MPPLRKVYCPSCGRLGRPAGVIVAANRPLRLRCGRCGHGFESLYADPDEPERPHLRCRLRLHRWRFSESTPRGTRDRCYWCGATQGAVTGDDPA